MRRMIMDYWTGRINETNDDDECAMSRCDAEMMSFGNSSIKKAAKQKAKTQAHSDHRERYRRRYAQQQSNKATMTTEMGW